MRVYICTYIYIYIHTYTYTYTRARARARTCTHTYNYTHTHISVCVTSFEAASPPRWEKGGLAIIIGSWGCLQYKHGFKPYITARDS